MLNKFQCHVKPSTVVVTVKLCGFSNTVQFIKPPLTGEESFYAVSGRNTFHLYAMCKESLEAKKLECFFDKLILQR
jgi:hypothetical protein